jgi:HAD superfamily hydrolase (TIGR01509 family)
MFPPPSAPARFPTLRRVAHPHGSHAIRARKPEAASFRAVESAVGVRGAGVVFFDDLEGNVRGARRAGWTAHLVDPAGDPAAQILARLP